MPGFVVFLYRILPPFIAVKKISGIFFLTGENGRQQLDTKILIFCQEDFAHMLALTQF